MAPPGISFDPTKDVSDLGEKTIVLSGGTGGLGAQIVKTLAADQPHALFFTGRNEAAAKEVQEAAKAVASPCSIRFVKCDMTSLASVKEAVTQIKSQTQRVNTLFCNAGVMSLPPGLTKDGYEIQFGVNHVAHALFIDMLLPLLKTSPDPRIIITSSRGMKMSPPLDFGKLKTEDRHPFLPGPIGPSARYCVTKLANSLYAAELARRYPDILTVSVHPGVINTHLISNLGWSHRALIYATTIGLQISLEEGTLNQLWAATTGREKVRNGAYYEPVGIFVEHTKQSGNEKLARDLWEWTAEELNDWLA